MSFGLKVLLILTVLTLAFIALGQHSPVNAAAGNCGAPAVTTARPARTAAGVVWRLLHLQSEDFTGR